MKRSSSKTAVKWRKESRPYLMLIPAALVLLLISVYPVLYGIYMSMTNKNLLRPGRNVLVHGISSLSDSIRPRGRACKVKSKFVMV